MWWGPSQQAADFALHCVGLFNPLPANIPFDVLKMGHQLDKTIGKVR